MIRNSASISPEETRVQAPRPMIVSKAVSSPNASENDPDYLLARFATYFKILSGEQAKQALEDWVALAGGQDFATFLLANRYVTTSKLDQLIAARDGYLQKQQNAPVVSSVTPQSPAPAVIPVTTPSVSAQTVPLGDALERTRPQAPGKSKPAFKSNVKPFARQEPAEKNKKKPDLLHYGPDVSLPDLLQQTSELGASDLHVHSGACLRVRLNGKVIEATRNVLTKSECQNLIQNLLNEPQRKTLKDKLQVDFSYEIPGVGRYRANAYQQRQGTDAVFRTIKINPPKLSELGLPRELERFTEFHQGLVLFTGPAGCGKSSTMAAMVNLINKGRNDHILTIEDPIEYVHESASCNVNQRETGLHTSSFSKALRAALREDPDVIVIGELRDLETISLAMTAAETGHLVLGTLHTSGAIRTINRLLGVFPPDQQAQLRVMLSESLKVVISQHLVRRADGRGQVPALEVMVNNSATGNLIRENRTFQIKSIMQTGSGEGHCLLDTSLTKLLINRVITKEEALRHADDPENFK
jgi:twitching motility protein PilT